MNYLYSKCFLLWSYLRSQSSRFRHLCRNQTFSCRNCNSCMVLKFLNEWHKPHLEHLLAFPVISASNFLKGFEVIMASARNSFTRSSIFTINFFQGFKSVCYELWLQYNSTSLRFEYRNKCFKESHFHSQCCTNHS